MNQRLPYPFLIIVILFFCSAKGEAQTLDWSSSFAPAWSNGATSRTATAVAPGLDIAVTITNSQGGTYQNVTFGAPAPAVNVNNGTAGFFIIAGSSDCLEIDVDWSSDQAYVDVVYTFTRPVYNLVFRVGDIDKNSSTSLTYADRVTVSGLNGSASVWPVTITPVNPAGNYLTISGNVIHANVSSGQGGNAATNSTSTTTQQSTAEVNFGTQAITQLTIRYDNHPAAQNNPALQAIAIGNLNFSYTNISGTVWNDVNNSANNSFAGIFSTGEAGTNGGGLFVNLVNISGTVLSSAAIAADGTYSLTAPVNTTDLTLRLSTSQGIAGAAAPSNNIPAGWINTSPLQTAPFTTATGNISGRDFGIEQPPQTATSVQSPGGNPGGYNFASVTVSAFQGGTGGNPNTGDYGNGTVTSIRITSFPTHTNAIRINNTTYINGGSCAPAGSCTAWPAAGVVVPYANGTGPTVPISIDPGEGSVSVVISFAAIDNAGKEDNTPGSVTLPFTSVPLSGLVFNDANGNLVQNAGEPVVNGTNVGAGLLPGAPLFANLVNPAGIVIASTPVQSNGTYVFSNIPPNTANLTIQINTIPGSVGMTKPAMVMPAGWASAGENKNGQGGAADATRNGEINLNAGNTTITLQNFCLDRLPVSHPKFYSIATPPVNAVITLNGGGSTPGTLSGNDPEDGSLGAASRVAITALPTEGNEIWYNGTPITVGANGSSAPSVSNPFVISNFNPSLLQVRATALGSLGTSFNYAFIDAANLQGAEASYLITWETPLPVTLVSFTGKTDNNNTLLDWTVENQEDFDRYEVEFRSNGASGYRLAGLVYSNNQPTGSYHFNHSNAAGSGNAINYRLKMIDKNGTYKYSHVVAVRFDKTTAIDVRPTLVYRGEPVRVNLVGNSRYNYQVSLLDVTGKALTVRMNSNDNIVLIETGKLNTGTYFVRVNGDGGEHVSKIFVQ